ncbi:MAG TPA: biopolymer transporter ExbD [Pyrinomonadaceae bacterium]|nr:biopolymer transporter ExbD [Pyrinomonadaceae bacterium]
MKNLKIISFLIILTLCGACSQLKQNGGESSNSATKSSAEKTDGAVNFPRNLKNSFRDFEIDNEISAVVTLPNNSDIFYRADKEKISADALGKKFEEYWGAMETLSNDTKTVYLIADSGNDYAGLVKIFELARKNKIYNIKLVVSPNDKADAKNVLEVLLPELPRNSSAPVKPNPLTLIAALQKDGKINLNNEQNTLDSLKARLKEVFRNREENGVFREGTNEVYKTVTVKGLRSAKYAEIAKLVDALKEAGASPILLQIDDLSD